MNLVKLSLTVVKPGFTWGEPGSQGVNKGENVKNCLTDGKLVFTLVLPVVHLSSPKSLTCSLSLVYYWHFGCTVGGGGVNW